MQLQLFVLITILMLDQSLGDEFGYHYDRPTKPPLSAFNTRNGFAPLSTVVPLPPLPALPPLPTALPSGHQPQFHTQQQGYPSGQPPASKSIAAAYYSQQSKYLPSTGDRYQIQQQNQQQQQQQFTNYGQRVPAQTYGSFYSDFASPSAPASNNEQSQAVAQPLRIPFGGSAPDNNNNIYAANGRQIKQYAVIEIIDNDIEQQTGPFLSSPFIDTYRARVGASGTGALPALPGSNGLQIDSRSSSLVLEQQRLSADLRPAPGDAIALGSGGLGFVRLSNGNIYLGSGSLAYISGKQHLQSINEARTRSGNSIPDALHFGHGPLTAFANNNIYRFK